MRFNIASDGLDGFGLVNSNHSFARSLALPQASKTIPSLGRGDKPTARKCPLGREMGFDIDRWNQPTGMGRIQAQLHLSTKPSVVRSRFLLLARG